MNAKKKKRVVVAMSGGVDSSVAALLLKDQGYDVIGMTMQVFDQSKANCDDFGKCCSPMDVYDARRVSDFLGIPFYVINLEKPFKKEVIDYFADSYMKGKTPNPCIVCNTKIKFESLLKRAFDIEADYIATGHYAKVKQSGGTYRLYKGKDGSKDQSYFLFDVNQEKLKHILFPLGNLEKQEVRKIALKAGLKTAEKGESQEICFVTNGKYPEFLEDNYKKHFKNTKGEFINSKGEVLGRHKGIHNYTIGQRKGLGISYKKPLYVLEIDAEKKRVVVGESEELYKNELRVANITWIRGEECCGKIKTKVRYQTPESNSRIEKNKDDTYRIIFDKPQKGITPGQAAVFYRGDEVLGGGWII